MPPRTHRISIVDPDAFLRELRARVERLVADKNGE